MGFPVGAHIDNLRGRPGYAAVTGTSHHQSVARHIMSILLFAAIGANQQYISILQNNRIRGHEQPPVQISILRADIIGTDDGFGIAPLLQITGKSGVDRSSQLVGLKDQHKAAI